MTTVLEAMREKALAEFDLEIERHERRFRRALRFQGYPPAEIDHMIGRIQPGLKWQRNRVAAKVAIALMQFGVPLEEEFEE